MEAWMARLHGSGQVQITRAFFVLTIFCICALMMLPSWANSPSATLGTIVFAERAHIGSAAASVGATVFGGDRLSTEANGSLQLRTASARVLLSGSSSASFVEEQAIPAATLAAGTATFSTADSKAFTLHVATAAIRPASDRPTIGRVTVLGPKEFIVRSTQGSLSLAVEDDLRVIPEGAAYRVVLEPPAAAEPQSGGKNREPVKAGKNKFAWYVVAAIGVVTFFALDEALESPDRP
jgi:hypothetical protein